MIINPGDFVDITVTVDIVSIKKLPREKKVDVHFAFTRVVQLASAQDLLMVSDPVPEYLCYHVNSMLTWTQIVGTQSPLQPQQVAPALYEDRLPFEDEDLDVDDETNGTESSFM